MLLNSRGHGMNTPFPRPSIRSSSIQFSMADVHGCFDNEGAVSGGELGCGNCEADFNADSVRNSNSAWIRAQFSLTVQMTAQSANLQLRKPFWVCGILTLPRSSGDLLSGCLGGVIYTRLLKVRSEDLNPGIIWELIGDLGPRTSHQLVYVRITRWFICTIKREKRWPIPTDSGPAFSSVFNEHPLCSGIVLSITEIEMNNA